MACKSCGWAAQSQWLLNKPPSTVAIASVVAQFCCGLTWCVVLIVGLQQKKQCNSCVLLVAAKICATEFCGTLIACCVACLASCIFECCSFIIFHFMQEVEADVSDGVGQAIVAWSKINRHVYGTQLAMHVSQCWMVYYMFNYGLVSCMPGCRVKLAPGSTCMLYGCALYR